MIIIVIDAFIFCSPKFHLLWYAKCCGSHLTVFKGRSGLGLLNKEDGRALCQSIRMSVG